MRCFAYKIGYMSKYRIEREARKPEPRLSRLIGHASLFDSAKKYIIDHIDDDDDDNDDELVHDSELPEEWTHKADDLDLPSIEEIEDLDLDDDDDDGAELAADFAQIQHHYQPQHLPRYFYQASTKCMSRPIERPQQVVLATTTTTTTGDQSNNNQDQAAFGDELYDWETVSNASTEAGDDEHEHEHGLDHDDSVSDSDWSDSTCANDEQHHHHHVDDARPDRKILDFCCALATSQFAMPMYNAPQNDDLLLWAEQPRVLSQSQADNLLVEVFA